MRFSSLFLAFPVVAFLAGCQESSAVDQTAADSSGLDSGLDASSEDVAEDHPMPTEAGPDSPEPWGADADADTGHSSWLRRLPLLGGDYLMPALAMAPSGDMLVAGSFGDTISIDGHQLDAGQSGAEFALVRLDRDGAVVWARSTSSEDARQMSASFNAAGEVFVAGELGKSGSFGGPADMGDSYVAKLGVDGTQLWIASWGANYDYEDFVAQVVVPDEGGGCAAAGTHDKDGPNGSNEQPLPLAVGYKPDGTLAWTTPFGLNEIFYASVRSASRGPGGSYVFGGSGVSESLTDTGWVVAVGPSGAISWKTHLPGPALAIGYDGLGALYVGGSLGGGPNSTDTSPYLAKLDTKGSIVWSHQWLPMQSYGPAKITGLGMLSPTRIAVGGVFAASSLAAGGATIPGDTYGTTSFIAVLDDESHCSGWHLVTGSDPSESGNGYPGLVSLHANGTGRAVAVGHAYTELVFEEPVEKFGDGGVFVLSLEP